ncbi:mediator complex subunit 23-domain-containing protein [Thamnocephalis sphaerospora]|uniref:Mediator complex subunit 23-domain-containing protein n=1 Tax=Thamnocephalis sphaerospora TaxID=78915 RepID=A0A4P9XVY7_9FUNG|nr:mediator complex subunit 23-domain-containing protein [Thamnocephalis sphaerospora]|eukprot:RKP10465.1 mediator complex subunit 23-domain-containing protein [Thamnocephalis sphaerospora]
MSDFAAVLATELASCDPNRSSVHFSTPGYCFNGLFTTDDHAFGDASFSEVQGLECLSDAPSIGVDEAAVERIAAALENAYIAGQWTTVVQQIATTLGQQLLPTQFVVLLAALRNFLRAPLLDSAQAQPHVAASLLGVFTAALDIASTEKWQHALSFLAELLRQPAADPAMHILLATRLVSVIVREINRLPTQLLPGQLAAAHQGYKLLKQLVETSESTADVSLPLVDIIPAAVLAGKPHWTLATFFESLEERRVQMAEFTLPPVCSFAPLAQPIASSPEESAPQPNAALHLLRIPMWQDSNIQGKELRRRYPLGEQLRQVRTQSGITRDTVLDAFFRDLEDRVVRCSTTVARMTCTRFAAHSDDSADVFVPEDQSPFLQLLPIADELYSLVDTDQISFEQTVDRFLGIAQHLRGQEGGNTNYLLWLLLQLLHIEKVGDGVVGTDLAGEERLFAKITELYEGSTMTTDHAFSLVDLAMPCSICHQQKRLRDKNLLKFRYPKLASAMPLAQSCFLLQTHFGSAYKANVSNRGQWHDISVDEMTRIAIVSQLRQHLVADTLYVYLVSCDELDVEKFPSGCTFLKGGNLDYRLLELVTVDCRHRLLQLIYKMMLDHESGPRFPNPVAANSVSPYVLDAVANIIYCSPCSSELMITEVFERLKRLLTKLAREAEGGDSTGQDKPSSVSDTAWRWIGTVADLTSGRLLRFLKYPFGSDIFAAAITALQNVKNRQVYLMLENLCISLVGNTDFLTANLGMLSRLSFAGLELPARVMMTNLARIRKSSEAHGSLLLPDETVKQAVINLSSVVPFWAPETLEFFPEPMKSFVQQTASLMPADDLMEVKPDQLLSLEPDAFRAPEHQPNVLIYLWWKYISDADSIAAALDAVRPALSSIAPRQLTSYTTRLVDHIGMAIGNIVQLESAVASLGYLLWNAQVLEFSHVVLALAHCGRGSGGVLDVLAALLFDAEEFRARVQRWCALFPTHRLWKENDYHAKLMAYLHEYPEHYQLENANADAEALRENTSASAAAVSLPVYYTSVVTRFLTILPELVGRFIESGRGDFASAVLATYGGLIKYRAAPLSVVRSILRYYRRSIISSDQALLAQLAGSLSAEDYPFVSEFAEFLRNASAASPSEQFPIEQIIARTVQGADYAPAMNGDRIERHFCEIIDATEESIVVAAIEAMAGPWTSEVVVQSALAWVCSSASLGTKQLTALARIFALLPHDEFVLPFSLALTITFLECSTQPDEFAAQKASDAAERREEGTAGCGEGRTKSSLDATADNPAMALLACIHSLASWCGPLVLQPVIEAISVHRLDLLATGRTTLVCRLLGPALAQLNSVPVLSSTCLFQLLGILVDLDASGPLFRETTDCMLDFFHVFLRSVTLPVDALMQAQAELATAPVSVVRNAAITALAGALASAASATINVSATVVVG